MPPRDSSIASARLLVGDRVRHAAGGLLFLAADHDRRAARPVLGARALRLGDAGEAAEHMRFAVLLGVAIGLGLLSKQAMIYFVLCVGLPRDLLAATRARR